MKIYRYYLLSISLILLALTYISCRSKKIYAKYGPPQTSQQMSIKDTAKIIVIPDYAPVAKYGAPVK